MLETVKGRPSDTPSHTATSDQAGLAIIELHCTGDASPEKMDRIEQLLLRCDAVYRSAAAYLVGNELQELGMTELADQFWRRSLTTYRRDFNYATLAGKALCEKYGTSRPDGDVLDESDVWRPKKARPGRGVRD